ncbi:MAG: YraN family protein [Candidatus Glassbacteria bacterium]
MKRSTGRRGEDIAVGFLNEAGYQIMRRNYRALRCEIDIIARKGNTLVFVEVKTRNSLAFGDPILSITPAKTRNIFKVARAFINEEKLSDMEVRFDAVTVVIRGDTVIIDHIKDAFRYSD